MRVRKELKDIALCAHGGKLQEIAGQLNVDGKALIDFSVNLNPYMPLEFEEVLRKAYDTVFEYPDNRYVRFRESAARFAGVGADNVIPGNGSTEIIRLIAEAVLEKGDAVAIPCPTFGEYEQQCRLFGAAIRHVRFDDIADEKYGQLDGCRAVFLCNPNNPDGRLVLRDGVENLIKYCQDNGIITIIDEAFIDLADPAQSVAPLVEKYDGLLVMRSLTKCFAIPGLRLGFGIAGKETADILNRVRLTWNLDSVAEEIGIHYMDHTDSHLEASRAFIKKEREWLAGRIGAIDGIKVLPACANFFLVDVGGTGLTSGEFYERMLREGVIVRDCRSFKMDGEYVRLAVRAREDNERLVGALARAARDTD